MPAISDWATLVFDKLWMQRLELLAQKRFGNRVLAEEAATYVIAELSQNNWQRLDGFDGHAKQSTYLNTVTSNLLEEFSRKKFGRLRAPEWLKQKGHLWVQIWKQLCLERQSRGAILHRLKSDERSVDYLEAIMRAIQGKLPWCGVKVEEVPQSTLLYPDAETEDIEYAAPVSDEERDLKYEGLLLLLGALLNSADSHEKTLTDALRDKLAQLQQSLSLDTEEILILRLVYIEGLKQTTVAKSMAIRPQQLNKRIKKALRSIETALSDIGIEVEEIKECLK